MDNCIGLDISKSSISVDIPRNITYDLSFTIFLNGMGLNDAFNIFLSQAVMEKGISFQIKIPNDETVQTIKDAREVKI